MAPCLDSLAACLTSCEKAVAFVLVLDGFLRNHIVDQQVTFMHGILDVWGGIDAIRPNFRHAKESFEDV